TVVDYGPQASGVANNLNPVSVTLSRGDGALAATTNTSYDNYGRIVSVDGPLSGTADRRLTGYNLAGQVLWRIGSDPDGTGAARYPAVKYAYRSDGQIQMVETG